MTSQQLQWHGVPEQEAGKLEKLPGYVYEFYKEWYAELEAQKKKKKPASSR